MSHEQHIKKITIEFEYEDCFKHTKPEYIDEIFLLQDVIVLEENEE